MNKRNFQHFAFTLVELLVVIAIIVLLLSILIPLLTRVKERTRRVICQSTIRSFHIALTAYASGNDDLLPQGGAINSNGDPDYVFLLQKNICESLAGNAYNAFVCPNLFKPFKGGNVNVFDEGSYIDEVGSFLIGYNYLGGFKNTPWSLEEPAEAEWISPRKCTDSSKLPVITELNTWIHGNYNLTFAPHGYWGPIHESKDSANSSYNGIPSDEIGSQVVIFVSWMVLSVWKDIEEMKIRKASLEPVIDLFAFW